VFVVNVVASSQVEQNP